ncbi:lytic transglycosylase domain-containing protein [Cellulomonas sp. P22]|uniref:lytic transglycosylase domain-containing protein n=1 Tax=Cellulomonas sp. P22 TaxID=3373189 RepID=UPI0037BC001A
MDAPRTTPDRSGGPTGLPPVAVIAVLLALGVGAATVLDRTDRPAVAWTVPAPELEASMPGATAQPHAGVDTSGLELTDNTLAGAEPTAPAVPRASAAWVDAVSLATAIPVVALRAYADATLTLGASQPGCRVGWTTIAAIGGIESGHGTHGGATLRADGTTSIRILGPALDGRPGFAAIPATAESTAWHGDATWDHAVGPMQFLPSSWERWGSDGDGDGVADPNDVDDAALATGRYLCASGGDLTGADAWHAAVFSYNHSEQYVADVLGAANRYATGSASAATTGRQAAGTADGG